VADSRPKAPVVLSKPIARRVRRAVKRVEAMYGHPPDQRSSSAVTPFLPIQPASVTTAIPTGTLASPSTSGRVTIYRDANRGAALVAAEADAVCKNVHTLSASIAVGKTVQVYWRAGTWWLIAADC
jgi:hypothetical protein